jgi:hypothetical protein
LPEQEALRMAMMRVGLRCMDMREEGIAKAMVSVARLECASDGAKFI